MLIIVDGHSVNEAQESTVYPHQTLPWLPASRLLGADVGITSGEGRAWPRPGGEVQRLPDLASPAPVIETRPITHRSHWFLHQTAITGEWVGLNRKFGRVSAARDGDRLGWTNVGGACVVRRAFGWHH
ncbi:hypothetical protein PoB_005274400 [Plakobranchus ocellatus]|uniref:Uncharacterized protein n=1 Tax=Plakobranchus ocellatus TaxID=259542 RepID=A0AAV4C160_9GAST|nr:hypothetical protein PoB_005274400 [Plakobranchus ocellatus]